MRRVLVLLALAFAPLLAAAHEGHHAPRNDADASTPSAEANGSIVAAAHAPSRCPGGDHEACCCNDAMCTPSFHPAVIASAEYDESSLAPASPNLLHPVASAPRAVPLPRYSPRGPPLNS